eukprot:m.858809 g.858809  ORF g.858809 m.858809 type:complete len:394 (+) comp23525_c0_seq1:370-1551(+)
MASSNINKDFACDDNAPEIIVTPQPAQECAVSDFDELCLAEDVYACAFVLASNATPGMYNFDPVSNPQMRLLWFYLSFISFSQSFALIALTVIAPPVVESVTLFVNCDNTTSEVFLRAASGLGFQDTDRCILELGLPVLEAQISGHLVQYRSATLDTLFYDNTLAGSCTLTTLQIVCCIWVMTHSYFRDFQHVQSLLQYRDFSRWFLPRKGEVLRKNSWVLLIPAMQWVLSTAIVSVSWCLIAGYSDPVDVVLNSMAFTFINEVAETFAEPVLTYYSKTAIAGLNPDDYGTEDILYIVTDYDEANAAYGDAGWYVRMDEAKAGLITDLCVRHQPDKYAKPNQRLIRLFRVLFFAAPPSFLTLCYMNTTGSMQYAPILSAMAACSITLHVQAHE